MFRFEDPRGKAQIKKWSRLWVGVNTRTGMNRHEPIHGPFHSCWDCSPIQPKVAAMYCAPPLSNGRRNQPRYVQYAKTGYIYIPKAALSRHNLEGRQKQD